MPRLRDMKITAIALVAKPANRRKFLMFKSEDGEGERVDISKPYPNEHACRLKQPGEFKPDSMRRTTRDHEGKKYSIIMGRLKGETKMTEQAYRYPKGTWSADAARSHCKDHKGTFEAAQKSEEGGDEMEKTELIVPLEKARQAIGQVLVDMGQPIDNGNWVSMTITNDGSTGPSVVEKKGTVFNKANLTLLKEAYEALGRALASAGVEKAEEEEEEETETDAERTETPGETETEEEVKEPAEPPPGFTLQDAEELKADVDSLCTEESFKEKLDERLVAKEVKQE